MPCRKRLKDDADRERAALLAKFAASHSSEREHELELKLIEVRALPDRGFVSSSDASNDMVTSLVSPALTSPAGQQRQVNARAGAL